jgi:hypothetical protein
MGAHFPSTGFSPSAPVGPESLSVAVAVKNAINDPLLSLKQPDANTQQQQPNISSTHVSRKISQTSINDFQLDFPFSDHID